jgi:hypothetical protein
VPGVGRSDGVLRRVVASGNRGEAGMNRRRGGMSDRVAGLLSSRR